MALFPSGARWPIQKVSPLLVAAGLSPLEHRYADHCRPRLSRTHGKGLPIQFQEWLRCAILGTTSICRTLLSAHKFRVALVHARKVRHLDIGLGWLMLRLPETHELLRAVVAQDSDYHRCPVLLTNIASRLD